MMSLDNKRKISIMVYFEISLTITLYITIVFTKILWIFQDTL